MNSRERVLLAIEHLKTDRVPIHATFVPQLEKKLEDHFKLKAEELYIELGNDLLFTLFIGVADGFYKKDSPLYIDDWGITWKWVDNYTEPYLHPLADSVDIADIKTPDPLIHRGYKEAINLINKYGKELVIVGCVDCSIFEAAWFLRGLKQVLIDFYENEEFINTLLDKTMNFTLQAGLKYIETGVDIIRTGDDFGTQKGLLISPQTWKKFFKPRYATLFENFRKKNKNIKIAYHSCGNIIAIIPDLIEIGLDILNPIQPRAMDPAYLKRQFGKNLTFWGGVDEQKILPFGTPEDVEAEVRQRISQLNGNGGYILGPSHNMQYDTSVDNVLAFYKAGKKIT